jgi:hypothetical protein
LPSSINYPCYPCKVSRVKIVNLGSHPLNVGLKTQELIRILAEIISLLEKEGETRWSAWMTKAKTWLEDLDYAGIEYLLRAYGGMGSFNDLMVSPERQDRLAALHTQAWAPAAEIKRDHTLDGT